MAREKSTAETRQSERGPAASGGLYVVATPIGNLKDISARALDVLNSVDLILAEDTRHSAKLLSHYGIATPCRSFHEHNETRQVAQIVKRISAGERLALVSDAGTPLINDPGYRLVVALREQGHAVIPIPGPSALVCALSVAGLATDRFCFEGFLPAKSGARRRCLQGLSAEQRTLVFYESPRRIREAMADLAAVFGPDRPAVLARELTKIHETVHSATLSALHAWIEARDEQRRGEFVIVVAGAAPAHVDEDTALVATRDLLRALMDELPVKKAVTVAARLTGGKRNALYQQAIALSNAAGDGTVSGKE